MLVLTLPMQGRAARVELDGVDISRHLHAIAVETSVGGVTSATLHYRGAAVVAVAGGRLTLVQAPLYVTCEICHATVRGESAEPCTAPIHVDDLETGVLEEE